MFEYLSLFLFISGAVAVNHTQFEIFYINLERRVERRYQVENEIERVFPDLPSYRVSAVDARNLNETILEKWKIHCMEGYLDPQEFRTMKYGEVGCFLSHHMVWQAMVDRQLSMALILEDDAVFSMEHYGELEEGKNVTEWRMKFDRALEEFVELNGELLYIGRRRNEEYVEQFLECDNCRWLTRPSYSYWTVAYMVTLEGAKKLLNTDILQRLIPVDEYLSMMFNENPIFDEWNLEELGDRASDILLDAYSLRELLAHPSVYPDNWAEYISDTSNSELIEKWVINSN